MPINLIAAHQSVSQWTGDALAIAVFATNTDPSAGDDSATKDLTKNLLRGDLATLDETVLAHTLAELITEQDFKGESGSSVSGRVGNHGTIRQVMLVGLGDASKATLDAWRKAAATAAKWANQIKAKSLGLYFPTFNTDDAGTVQAISEGLYLSLHQDQRFKSKDPKPQTLVTVSLLTSEAPAITTAIETAAKTCDGVILARELVSAPANVVTPLTLAATAQEIAASCPHFTAQILDRDACAALGMGAFLGVAQASDIPPQFIHLTYRNGNPSRKLAIVGKGLTFDSGGLNLKTGVGSSIELMKTDMGGAAATLGTAQVLAKLQPQDLEVHFIVATCENMVSGRAMRPGDILTASNGITIEVNNTDAEGRLTLADALVYADKLGVDAIVDLATLTGACVVALGEKIAGMWANDDNLAQQLSRAADHAGEQFWRMPLEDSYFDQMKSVVADCRNTGSRAGGAITGALFLKQFVNSATPWAHLDVAGPVWTEKESGYNNAGGTGFAVRTLVNWVLG
ncbi:MAG: leucyl aminopeptidase [Pseudanabaenaceae cyanobacterium]|jgi:leucyl aminopeptidase